MIIIAYDWKCCLVVLVMGSVVYFCLYRTQESLMPCFLTKWTTMAIHTPGLMLMGGKVRVQWKEQEKYSWLFFFFRTVLMGVTADVYLFVFVILVMVHSCCSKTTYCPCLHLVLTRILGDQDSSKYVCSHLVFTVFSHASWVATLNPPPPSHIISACQDTMWWWGFFFQVGGSNAYPVPHSLLAGICWLLPGITCSCLADENINSQMSGEKYAK